MHLCGWKGIHFRSRKHDELQEDTSQALQLPEEFEKLNVELMQELRKTTEAKNEAERQRDDSLLREKAIEEKLKAQVERHVPPTEITRYASPEDLLYCLNRLPSSRFLTFLAMSARTTYHSTFHCIAVIQSIAPCSGWRMLKANG